ncbi:hypothetical protein [Helicobacter sp. 23-1045]
MRFAESTIFSIIARRGEATTKQSTNFKILNRLPRFCFAESRNDKKIQKIAESTPFSQNLIYQFKK